MDTPYIGRKIKYPDFVCVNKISSNEEEGLRYSLYIPFETGMTDNDLVVILKNPSSASYSFCDTTISRVCHVAFKHGYSGVIILNLFPYRATKACQVTTFFASPNYHSFMSKNLKLITRTCQGRDVVFAWGKNSIGGNKQFPNFYNNAVTDVTTSVVHRTHYVDRCSCISVNCASQSKSKHPDLRFPLHGLRWKNDSNIYKY